LETAGAGGNRGIKTSPLGEIERESVATMEKLDQAEIVLGCTKTIYAVEV
jgi:hypothetical protein